MQLWRALFQRTFSSQLKSRASRSVTVKIMIPMTDRDNNKVTNSTKDRTIRWPVAALNQTHCAGAAPRFIASESEPSTDFRVLESRQPTCRSIP
jgi:hypothetical protein